MPDTAVLGDLTPNDFAPSDQTPFTTPLKKGSSSTPPNKGPPTTPSEKGPPATPSEKGHLTAPSNKGPPATPSEKGLPTIPPNKGPPTTPSEEWPSTTPSEKAPPTTPFKEGAIMNLLNKKQFKYPSTSSWKRPPISPFQKISTANPYDNLLPIEWKHEDWGLPKHKIKFVFETATQPPLTRSVRAGAMAMKLMGCFVIIVLALRLLSTYMNRRCRTRRGVVIAANAVAVEQDLQAVERTPSEPGEPGPLNNDLPPSYYECTLYSMSEGVGEVPPPYTNPVYLKQPLDGFVENKRRACSEDVAQEMRTEL